MENKENFVKIYQGQDFSQEHYKYEDGVRPYTPAYEATHIFRGYRLCGRVIRVPAYRSRGSGLDSRRYYIF
jgi:hypothetical protein